MKRIIRPQRLAAAIACALALLIATSASAQAPEQLAPADTAVFIHIEDPAEWFDDLTEGPLGKKIRDQLETQEGSGDLLAALGMNMDEFMDAYFGGDVVLLSPGGDADGVIFTQVDQDQREHAIDSLFLRRQGDVAGHPLYVGQDGGGYFVMMDDWVALCDASAADYLESILKQGEDAERLADTKRYKKWTKELPNKRSMTALIYEGEDTHHALGVERKGRALDATYLGTSPDFTELLGLLGETQATDFGPLPADTIAAVSFNLVANDEMREQFAGLDPLLRGKSFVDDVMPMLDSPTLLFMGSIDGDGVKPKVDVEMPVLGMAMKMKDDAVADDLKAMFDGMVLIANFAVAEFQAGPVNQRTESYKETPFQVAEIGKPIAKGVDFPELAPMQIVYGQVGEYFIVCTQEAYFKQCIDANAGNKRKRIELDADAHRLAKTPVLAMTARPDGMGSMMLSWGEMLSEKGLPDAIAAEDEMPLDIETLLDVVEVMQQYETMTMQVWSGDDDLVIVRATLEPSD